MAPSVATSTAIPAATAASVSGGTPMDSVAVVSSGDASQSSSADSAGSEHTCTHTHTHTERSRRVLLALCNRVDIYSEILLLCVKDSIVVFTVLSSYSM